MSEYKKFKKEITDLASQIYGEYYIGKKLPIEFGKCVLRHVGQYTACFTVCGKKCLVTKTYWGEYVSVIEGERPLLTKTALEAFLHTSRKASI